MLFSNFIANPFSFLIFIILLLIVIAVHEFAHAKMADHLGDPTPRLARRLTLNPIAHIDLFGLLFLFFFGFGWGKPVPFDPFNLKNPRKDAALISLAGPLSNFIMAIAASLLLRLLLTSHFSFPLLLGKTLLIPFIYLNVMLGTFNLLPIAPLDGFKVVGGLLSKKQAEEWYGLERYGIIFLLLLIFPIGRISMLQMILVPLVQFLNNLLIPSLYI